jgi:HK97 family phage portal protein
MHERRALGHPALWRCVNIVAGSIASMPIHAYRGLERLESVSKLLTQPSPSRPRSMIWHQLMYSALMHGNGVAILSGPDRLGWPQRMRPVHPLRMVARLVDGEIVEYAYFPATDDGEQFAVGSSPNVGQINQRPVRWLDPSEVFHMRWVTIPGEAFGLGVMQLFQRELGLAEYLREHAGSWFEGGGIPSGILQLANPNPSQEIVDRAKEDWMRKHGGPRREPAVLPGDVTFQPVAATPQDTQLLASRQYSNLEIALMFGVPAYMIEAQQSSRSMTYSNVEDEGIQFLRTTLMWWLVQIEETLTTLIPGVQYTKFNVDGLLRSDTLNRYQAHQIAANVGFLSIDEIRRLEGRPPFGEPSQENQPAEEPPNASAAAPAPPGAPAPPTPPFTIVGGHSSGG